MNAEIISSLGDGRWELKCEDGIKRVGLLRGTTRRRVATQLGDIVLIQLREYEYNKCDIISKVETNYKKIKSYIGQDYKIAGKDLIIKGPKYSIICGNGECCYLGQLLEREKVYSHFHGSHCKWYNHWVFEEKPPLECIKYMSMWEHNLIFYEIT